MAVPSDGRYQAMAGGKSVSVEVHHDQVRVGDEDLTGRVTLAFA